MRPYQVPAGLTVHDAMTTLLPEEHALRAADSTQTYRGLVKIRGAEPSSYHLEIKGRSLTVSPGEPPTRDFWIVTHQQSFARVLEDLAGPHLLIPRELPWDPVVQIMTDPRMLARLMGLEGIIRLSLSELPGDPSSIWVAVGVGARSVRYVDEHEPDASIDVPYRVLAEVAQGRADLASAGNQGRLRIQGSKVLAMQFGLVLSMLTTPAAQR